MSRIFLSHSSVDELEAIALQQWMATNGWEDVFLDIDPQRGLAAGERWQEALRRAGGRPLRGGGVYCYAGVGEIEVVSSRIFARQESQQTHLRRHS